MSQKLKHTIKKAEQSTPGDAGDTEDRNVIAALQGFLERPHNKEIADFKDFLSEGVGIMTEILDFETGLPLHFFAHGKVSLIVQKKALILDKEQRRKAREFQKWIEEFELMTKNLFEKLSAYISLRIGSIKKNVEKEIDAIDNTLSASSTKLAASNAGAATVAAVKERKHRLKDFLSRLNSHSENLENAENTGELLDIEEELEDDVVSFDERSPYKGKKGIAAFFASIFDGSSEINAQSPADLFEETQRENFGYCAPDDYGTDDTGDTDGTDGVDEDTPFPA